MTYHTDLSLKNFFIFNTNYGQKEGEEEKKIMYYFPTITNIDVQIKDVGLSEAIIKFSDTFSGDPCEALQTEKTRRLFFQPEPNFWMIMTVDVPTVKKGKDGLEGIEYRGPDVQNTVFLAVLKQSYSMAKLFLGPFTKILESQNGECDELKRKLNDFFTRYLITLSLKNCDILQVFQGVQFLPLDKTTFLHSQCFVNLIEATFPAIDFSVFLYKEQLIWSGLPPEDVEVVFRYITTNLLPSKEMEGNFKAIPHQEPKSGRFLTGPTNIEDNTFTGKVPKVYLSSVPDVGFYHLIVYKVKEITLCLFVDCGEALTMEFYRELNSLAGPRLAKLTSELATFRSQQEALSSNDNEPEARFVYFNSMNLATKSTVHDKNSSSIAVTKDVLRILVDIHDSQARLLKSGCQSGETIAKTLSNHWIVGKMSNSREFYVTIGKKETNLVEVSDEVKKICDKQLKSIFFHV